MFGLVKNTISSWQDNEAPVLAAALAYYTLFSLAPLLIIIIAVLGLFFGQGQAQEQLVNQLQGFFGEDVAATIITMIENRSQAGGNVLASIIGITLLLFGATGVFSQLQNALNKIWKVEPSPKTNSILRLIRVRVLSLGMVLVAGFLLLVSFVLSAAISAISANVSRLLPGNELLWRIIDFGLSFTVISVLFALIFKYLPDAKTKWEDLWVGAAITSLLFIIGKFLIGLYLGNSAVSSSYGAAGSLVVLLMWVYFSALIVLFGAEFTYQYAERRGAGVVPAPYAVDISEA